MPRLKREARLSSIRQARDWARGGNSGPPGRGRGAWRRACEPITIACYAEPMQASAAYREYGVQLLNPYRVFCDIGDAASVTMSAECQLFGLTLAVQSMPKLF